MNNSMYFSFRDNHLYYAWDQICLVTDIIRSSYLFFFLCFAAGSHCVSQTGLELTILLYQPFKCWEYRLMSPHSNIKSDQDFNKQIFQNAYRQVVLVTLPHFFQFQNLIIYSTTRVERGRCSGTENGISNMAVGSSCESCSLMNNIF